MIGSFVSQRAARVPPTLMPLRRTVGIDVLDDVQAAADERRALDRRRLFPVLDEIALAAGEVEDAGDRIHAAPAQAGHVDAAFRRGQDVGGLVLSAVDEGVGHAGDGQIAEAFPAAVAGPLGLDLFGREDVGHELDQDAVLDQDVALLGRAFIVEVRRAAEVR
jgi:hypothetical protein